ncbi:MAG: flagellar basal-body MS-ring/collar protein FliF [Thermodesulfobacteriota bacterium]|nr:flagellar basal-body MS-ring/collar protein FliF [Thermodesulfobacteriota bacterium]
MKINFEQIFEQLNTLFISISWGKRIAIILFALGTFSVFVFIIIFSKKADFMPLYYNLNPEDAGLITSKLKEYKIPYKLENDGTTVLVSKENLYDTRLTLAAEGLPQGGGIGFEIFDKEKFGVTDFIQNVNYQRALQGELTRTINQLDIVEQSRVHLVIPPESTFIEDQKLPTASVVIKFKTGKRLTKRQIEGIIHLLSSSVAGLVPNNVNILDMKGNLISQKIKDDILSSSDLHITYQTKIEKKLEDKIQSMLEKVIGKENVITRVSVELDFNQVQKTEEIYDPDTAAIRSAQKQEESSTNMKGIPTGVPGVMSNLSPDQNVEKTKNKEMAINHTKSNETKNYEVSKIVRNIVEPMGRITRLSVAVMLDGTYQNISDVKDGMTKKYIPRTQEEIAKYQSIIKNAVGYNEKRGDQIVVTNIPFEVIEKAPDFHIDSSTSKWVWWVKKIDFSYLYLLFSFLILYFLLVRPFFQWVMDYNNMMSIASKKPAALPKTLQELEEEMEKQQGEAEEDIASTKDLIQSKAKTEKVLAIAKNDPRSTADLLKNWLSQD